MQAERGRLMQSRGVAEGKAAAVIEGFDWPKPRGSQWCDPAGAAAFTAQNRPTLLRNQAGWSIL